MTSTPSCFVIFILLFVACLGTASLKAQEPSCHWVSTLTGPNVQSFGSCDADENGYLYSTGFKLGRTSRTNFFSPNDQLLNDSINNSMVITKTDAAGDFLWTKELIDLTGYFSTKTKTDHNGSFYLAGTFYGTAVFDPSNPSNSTLQSFGVGRLSYYIAKYTVEGNFLWAEKLDALSISGSIQDIGITNDGNLAIVGTFDSLLVANNNTILGQGSNDAFLAIYDGNGNFQSIDTWGTSADDRATSVCFDEAGMMYLSIQTNATEIDADPGNGVNLVDLSFNPFFVKSIVLKRNITGQFEWAKTNFSIHDHYVNSLRISPTGELCAAGVFLGSLNPDLNGLNTETYPSNDTTGIDSYLAKYTLNGDLIWFKNIGSGVAFQGTYQSILFDDFDNLHTTGFFTGNTDFNPDSPIDNYSTNSVNPFIWSLSSEGSYRWTIPIISPNAAWAHSYALTNQGKNIYVVGDFSGEVQFNDAAGYTLTSEMATETEFSSDGYIAKYSICDLLVNIESDTLCDTVYSWDNQLFYESGTYFQVTQNELQCDSISVLELQLNRPTSASIALSDCQPITINDQEYDVSGNYSQTLVNSVGCDSTLTIQFTRLYASYSALNSMACAPVTINSITYNQSGNYTQTLLNEAGCDSLLTIDITIDEPFVVVYNSDSAMHATGNFTSIQWVSCPSFEPIPGATSNYLMANSNQAYAAIVSINNCVDTSACRLFLLPRVDCANLTIYPNPMGDWINFTYRKEKYPIYIYASNGALVYAREGSSSDQAIDISSFASGLYMLRVDECVYKIVK